MKRIVIVSHTLPSPAITGSHRRVADLIRHLRCRGHCVDLLLTNRGYSKKEIRRQRQHVDGLLLVAPPRYPSTWLARIRLLIRAVGGETLEHQAVRTLGILRRLRARITRSPQTPIREENRPTDDKQHEKPPGFRFPPKTQDAVSELIRQGNYDVVIVETLLMASLVVKRPGGKRLWVVDATDVMHQRTDTYKRFNIPLGGTWRYTREQEIDGLGQFDVIVAIQEEEKETFQEMLPDKTVVWAGISFPVQRVPCRRDSITFIGSLAPSNGHGITRILREAWPEVIRARPDAVLDIYGKVCFDDDVIRSAAEYPSSVVLHGLVDDLNEAYQSAVVIAPLWAGSGLKIKVVEALARGKAVVTTTVGAQGMAEGIGTAFRVAETPAEFAAEIIDLLEHPAKRESLADAGYAYVARKFSETSAYKELDEVLESPVNGIRPATAPADQRQPKAA